MPPKYARKPVVSAMGGTRGKKGALKKTTAKGAYGKRAKKNFGKRRRPFVETKTRESITVNMANRTPPAMGQTFDVHYPNILEFQNLPVDDAFTVLEPRSFTRMCQGVGEDKMIGESVYSRFIKQKVTFRYPGGANQIAFGHNMYLIHGWVTVPMALTSVATNTWGSPSVLIPAIDGIDQDSLKSYIAYQVKQHYNEREDKMRFVPKRTTNVKILSYRKVRTDRNSQPSMTPASGDAVAVSAMAGQLPDIHMTNTWKTSRKIHYVLGKDVNLAYPAANPLENDVQQWFPNYAWLPFTCIYNPDFATQKKVDGETNAVIELCHNDQHWYTDA